MESILNSIPSIDEENPESTITLEQIQSIDASLNQNNPMTYIIYLEHNKKNMTEEEKDTTNKIIEKLKRNNDIIAKNNIKKFFNEIKCENTENVLDKVLKED